MPTPRTLEEACALLAAIWAENVGLRVRVEELEARLAQTSANSSRPPSSDPPSTPPRRLPPSGRAPGGQPGHPAHPRRPVPPERVDAMAATCKQHNRSLLAYLTDVCTAAQRGDPLPSSLPAAA